MHNAGATKALFDLARELSKGNLPPDVEAMLQSELVAKSKVLQTMLDRYEKGDKKK